LADYRDHYQQIRAAGADVAAISVDPPEKSEFVRRQLRLPFTVLCDTERCVIREWNIYNPVEKGGIAKPAVFIVGPDRVVRLASMDSVVSRVPASEILRDLGIAAEARHPRRKRYIPSPSCFFRAIRNAIRLGVRSGK
jgi:peroxiredoxin